MYTSTSSAENLIEIGAVVSGIWPGEVKNWGCIYSSRCVYLAKYGMSNGYVLKRNLILRTASFS